MCESTPSYALEKIKRWQRRENKMCESTPSYALEKIKRWQRAEAILDERDRQDSMWGTQDHSLPEWMVILMEEVGELADAISAGITPLSEPKKNWREEAIQVAAVALAMVEQVPEGE